MEKITVLKLEKMIQKIELIEKEGSVFLTSQDYQKCIDLFKEIEIKIEKEKQKDYKTMITLCNYIMLFLETGKTDKLKEEFYKTA